MKRYFTMVFAVIFIFAFFACNNGSGSGDSTINIAAIGGVFPQTGAIPRLSIDDTPQYTGTVEWTRTPTSTNPTPVTTPFMPNISYTATITITPRAHYTLDGVPQNFFTVAGTSSGQPATNAENRGVVTAVFPPTGGHQPFNNEYSRLPINAPAQGAAVIRVLNNNQFSGEVEWTPNISQTPPTQDVFQPNTVYTAVITLKPRETHTWDGVPANHFTIEGARTVTNPLGTTFTVSGTPPTTTHTASGTVHAVFYPFSTLEISASNRTIVGKYEEGSTDPPLLLHPVTGVEPLLTINAPASGTPTHDQYRGTVEWWETTTTGEKKLTVITGTTKFLANTVYRADIQLVAHYRPGTTTPPTQDTYYSLANLPADFFTVQGAVTTHFDSSTRIVTAIFPATAGP